MIVTQAKEKRMGPEGIFFFYSKFLLHEQHKNITVLCKEVRKDSFLKLKDLISLSYITDNESQREFPMGYIKFHSQYAKSVNTNICI